MNDHIDKFLSYLVEVKQASTNTIRSYQNDLKKFGEYIETICQKQIETITETDMNSYILYLEKEGRSPSTISRNLAVIRSFALFLIRTGVIKQDPTQRVKAPRVEKKEPQALTIEEVECLLEQPDISTAKGLRDRAMLELIYATGIRATELVELSLDDINLKHGFLCTKEEESHKSRLVPIGSKAKQVLQEYLEQGREALAHDSVTALFVNRFGQPMTRQGFWKLVKFYANKAGIEKAITPQMLRHTFAIHLVEHGADLYSVQELLGHSDISSTQIYNSQKGRKVLDVYKESHPRA